MYIKQISIFGEDKLGRLAEITKILSDSKINIRALSIADTTDSGVLRLVVDNPDLAQHMLQEKGLTVNTTDVLGVCVDQMPDGLAALLKFLDDKNIAIEYMYAFTESGHETHSIVLLHLDKQEEALALFQENNMKLATMAI